MFILKAHTIRGRTKGLVYTQCNPIMAIIITHITKQRQATIILALIHGSLILQYVVSSPQVGHNYKQ